MYPNKIGDGMNAARLIIVKPIPMATGLSLSSTHLWIINDDVLAIENFLLPEYWYNLPHSHQKIGSFTSCSSELDNAYYRQEQEKCGFAIY